MSGICRDRVVVVTGAGQGLGREHALALAAEGAQVAVTDEIKTTGGTAIAGPGIDSQGATT